MNEEHDSFAWGLASGQSQIVTGVAIVAGGLMAHYLSSNALFITMGIIQVIATVVQARLLFRQHEV